jgi:hypothetical protein
MPEIRWEEPFGAEASDCFRLGTDDAGNAYIALTGHEDTYITDTREALTTMIQDIKAGKADHLL